MKIDLIREKITPTLEKHGASKAILFGSLARKTSDQKSDIDLIIIDDKPIRYISRLDTYYDDLVDALQCSLDLFVYTSVELRRMQELPFVNRALKEGVVLYER